MIYRHVTAAAYAPLVLESAGFIDVREPHEWEISRIDGARLIPLHRLESALQSIDRSAPVAVYCKVGTRSALAVRGLLAAGYRQVWSVTGGIVRWSREVDDSVAEY